MKTPAERWRRVKGRKSVEKRHTTEKFGRMGEGSKYPPTSTFNWQSPPKGAQDSIDFLRTPITKDSGNMYGGSDAIAGHGEGEFFAEKARRFPTIQTKDLSQEIFDTLNTPEAEQLGRDAQAGARKFKMKQAHEAEYGGIGEEWR